jgi:hypothetical protein
MPICRVRVILTDAATLTTVAIPDPVDVLLPLIRQVQALKQA